MNCSERSILIKLSGEIFGTDVKKETVNELVNQIATLASQASIAIVIGGGNFFRGRKDSDRLGMCETAGHEVGMLATVMNGRILQNLLKKNNVPTRLMSAVPCDLIAQPLSSYTISAAMKNKECMIFAGGLGTPFFTTDTAAVARALQVNATEIWKATTVDGIYNGDPRSNSQATLLKSVTFDEVLEKKLQVMDLTAMTLAQERNLKIRIFNIFTPNSLVLAFNDPNFGSIVQ
jgi:uridylate kinase